MSNVHFAKHARFQFLQVPLDSNPTIFLCNPILNFAGTMIPKSGGDYAYIMEAFGPLPAFLYLWVALFILVPTGNAITAITFAQYILQPLWGNCPAPYEAVRLLAAATTCVLTVSYCLRVPRITNDGRVKSKYVQIYLKLFVDSKYDFKVLSRPFSVL